MFGHRDNVGKHRKEENKEGKFEFWVTMKWGKQMHFFFPNG